MISDEQRSRLTELALKALDTIEADYGEDAELADAILIYEIKLPDGATDGNWHSTNTRASVNVGMLSLTVAAIEQRKEMDE